MICHKKINLQNKFLEIVGPFLGSIKMTVQINVKADIKQVTRYLTSLQKKQLPFATKNALDDTAWAARKELRKQAEKKLDRPTRFTVNGFMVEKSKKTHLVSSVFIKDPVWKYLQWQIEGGKRHPNARYIPVPAGVALNRFGNIPGRKRGPKTKKQFIADIDGTIGVWEQTTKGHIKLLIRYTGPVDYKPRFLFYRIAQAIGQKKFVPFFNIRLRQALATAR